MAKKLAKAKQPPQAELSTGRKVNNEQKKIYNENENENKKEVT